jgi:hypothetical protein
VKEGLVQEPEQWAWSSCSSCSSYALGEPGKVKLNDWPPAELKMVPAA